MELNQVEPNPSKLIIQDWGLIDYAAAIDKQMAALEMVHAENLPGIIVFCTHPEIVTLGRATESGDIFSWDGPTTEVSRGGRATYHGPSQLVIYPIINLKHSGRLATDQQDVVGHLRKLESSIIDWLKTLNINSQGKTLDIQNRQPQHDYKGQPLEETGVWVEGQKIASLGIAVKKWITYHGAAINMFADENAFRGLYPCGFSRSVMTNVESRLNRKIDLDYEKQVLANILASRL